MLRLYTNHKATVLVQFVLYCTFTKFSRVFFLWKCSVQTELMQQAHPLLLCSSHIRSGLWEKRVAFKRHWFIAILPFHVYSLFQCQCLFNSLVHWGYLGSDDHTEDLFLGSDQFWGCIDEELNKRQSCDEESACKYCLCSTLSPKVGQNAGIVL